MTEIESACMEIIASSGSAKTCFIEAIHAARDNQFALAEEKIAEGDLAMRSAQRLHFSLIVQEASKENVPFSMMLMHAEDQMMAAEEFRILAIELIALYHQLVNLQQKNLSQN